jgi:hypothetical protein
VDVEHKAVGVVAEGFLKDAFTQRR